MRVRIPNRPESEPAYALAEAIRIAAHAMHVPEGMAAMITSHVFEQIARQISRGRDVRVTGFGLFSAHWFRPPSVPNGHAVPKFTPSRGLRQEVRACVLSSQLDERQRLRYQKRNRVGSTPGRVAQQTWSSQQTERERILRENFGVIEMD